MIIHISPSVSFIIDDFYTFIHKLLLQRAQCYNSVKQIDNC